MLENVDVKRQINDFINSLREEVPSEKIREFLLSLVTYQYLAKKLTDSNFYIIPVDQKLDKQKLLESLKRMNNINVLKDLFSIVIDNLDKLPTEIPFLEEINVNDIVDPFDRDFKRIVLTPKELSDLIAKLVLIDKKQIKNLTVYDPTLKLGELLIGIKDNTEDAEVSYFGQEISNNYYDLARINLILSGISLEKLHLANHNSLLSAQTSFEQNKFDVVVENPPFAMSWDANKKLIEDPRFQKYGVVPPKSRADFAFILDGLYHLNDMGTMVIIVPNGVLFREFKDKQIRQKIIEDNLLDGVINLPTNLFSTTAISVTLLVLKKSRENTDVLFIDATDGFETVKRQNVLRKSDIEKIINTYQKRKNVDKYAHVADLNEIKKNDFNLNMVRYVDKFDPGEQIDLETLSKSTKELQQKMNNNQKELIKLFEQIKPKNNEVKIGIKTVVNSFKKDTYKE